MPRPQLIVILGVCPLRLHTFDHGAMRGPCSVRTHRVKERVPGPRPRSFRKWEWTTLSSRGARRTSTWTATTPRCASWIFCIRFTKGKTLRRIGKQQHNRYLQVPKADERGAGSGRWRLVRGIPRTRAREILRAHLALCRPTSLLHGKKIVVVVASDGRQTCNTYVCLGNKL